MATFESYLTTIADAIRQKKGTTELIKASNFASEILSIQGGGSLNVAYSLTPPTDTSKIWLQCAEPSGVEVQNYLGECAVSNVANYGVISNPVPTLSRFDYGYYNNLGFFSSCYIGNNRIAIVGYDHIRIYDLISKNYIADYNINVGTTQSYTNVLFKNNVLYFGYGSLYSFDLSTQTLTKLYTYDYSPLYIFFNGDNYIETLHHNYSSPYYYYHYRYDLENSNTTLLNSSSYTRQPSGASNCTIKVNNVIYNFTTYKNFGGEGKWKYDINRLTFTEFTSFTTFINSIGLTGYTQSSTVYDGERYIYLIGGNCDLIIKYDVLNDSFELLDQKLIGSKYCHYSLLVDNRIYIFGGLDDRKNQIDYFDLSYPLTQNNAIITTNTINTDNALPLINTEKLKINSNIASAYLGNADNLAEKVNAYYYDGSKWVGINCEDYVESESSGTGGGLNGGGDATTDPEIPVDKPVEI